MAKVKFLHYPGYIADLMTIFSLYFNKNFWPSIYANPRKIKEDTDFFTEILKEFGDIPDELLLFFYYSDMNPTFSGVYFLNDFSEESLQKFNFDTIKNKIADSKTMSEKIFSHYFPDNKTEIDFADKRSIDTISDIINASGYTDIIKFRLLSYFVKPERILQQLKEEFIKKEALLAKYYERQYKLMVETQESFDFDIFTKMFSEAHDKKINLEYADTAYVSFCLIAKNRISAQLWPDSVFCFLGYDYLAGLKYLEKRTSKIDIDSFGKIMNDKNRMEILEMLLVNNELTTTEIAKNLNLSVNAAFYHLNMMIQSEMLFTRNEGRTVFYQINKQYFRIISQAILKYSSDKN